ncbi:hypothetical protein D9M68_737900 [compost metagenome]
MVKHLENGYLADYRSASDLADGIEWLFLHEDKEAVHKEARRTILTTFSPKTVADQHIALYENLIHAQPR